MTDSPTKNKIITFNVNEEQVPAACENCPLEAPLATFGYFCPYIFHTANKNYVTTNVRSDTRLPDCPVCPPMEREYKPSQIEHAASVLRNAANNMKPIVVQDINA